VARLVHIDGLLLEDESTARDIDTILNTPFIPCIIVISWLL
jgi:hypothetical protein